MKRFFTTIFAALIITAILIVFEIGELLIIGATIDLVGLAWTAIIFSALVFVIVAAIIALTSRFFRHKHWWNRKRHHRNR
jgi:amino acid transporter